MAPDSDSASPGSNPGPPATSCKSLGDWICGANSAFYSQPAADLFPSFYSRFTGAASSRSLCGLRGEG